ncbi:helix-turn-helix domain-containing protein [uncultured Clostridium sp.]|uniref:helix-turn-helix domain-containing protein n=1 Tax=uncultured Clostridium sp. TaxID=59620 RepID=UPI00272BD9AC|nr:helix-turn-helix transcriptional regulator [uncultured Clostridium sp.]
MELAVDYLSIGDRIRERRKFLKLSQENLANEIGVSASFISDIENGRRKMSLETMIKISIALDTSLDYLVLDNRNSHKIKSETKLVELKGMLEKVDIEAGELFLDLTLNSAKFLANR